MSDLTKDYSFGGWLRQMRIDSGLTLRQAAKHIGMDVGNLSKLERSELAPPKKAKYIDRLCKKLGGKPELLKSLAFQHHLSELKKEFFG